MAFDYQTEITPREYTEHDWRVEEFEKQAAHVTHLKELDLEILREQHKAEIELRTLEAKWTSWLKIPLMIIKLPMLIILAIAYIFAIAFNYQPPKRFWDLLG